MSPVPAGEPALDLAVAFLNTYDLFPAPTDRLTVPVVRTLTERHGYAGLGRALGEGDLDALRALRGRLYPVFAAATAPAKAAAVNAVLSAEGAGAALVEGANGLRLAAAGGRDPVGRLAVVLADALAHALATGGAERLGTCAGDPCRCAYVDRTRGGRQRYCCELCNDRMAAAAYRQRKHR